ncbi:carbohydrate ABC transporter permease [Amnibacterium sp. CER49]|uniref:carbohydrate ABC transporter permease n=1 Tax=Amnibacterium sp. CER49 TaxID=3039161 RepID=UPI00244AA972|nr:carbohydrate ABC transporter permease [Amnibacterium sp. CER49]MDH2442851.1 carbohydrate ABC transporter permease [Amnibacterium sp. CER49]
MVGLLSLLALLAVYPILFMAIGSVKGTFEFFDSPLALPRNWFNFENYRALASRFDLIRLLGNTGVYAGVALALSLLLALPISYALAKLSFPGRRILFGLVVGSMGIPTIAILIPDYLFFVGAGFGGTGVSVIGVWTARSLPGTIFLLTALLRALPSELIEAAKLDGAGYLKTMTSVVVPLSVPGLVTASIFSLTAWWNDVLIPVVFLQEGSAQTITGGVATLGQRLATQDFPLTMAGLLVAAAAPILLYLLLQGYIRRGLVMGAVK